MLHSAQLCARLWKGDRRAGHKVLCTVKDRLPDAIDSSHQACWLSPLSCDILSWAIPGGAWGFVLGGGAGDQTQVCYKPDRHLSACAISDVPPSALFLLLESRGSVRSIIVRTQSLVCAPHFPASCTPIAQPGRMWSAQGKFKDIVYEVGLWLEHSLA